MQRSRQFYTATLPALINTLSSLANNGVPVVCVNPTCSDCSSGLTPKIHTVSLDLVICCDMACLKLILNRQNKGNVSCGCLLCNHKTNVNISYPKASKFQLFTDEMVSEMSNDWVNLARKHQRSYSTEELFEKKSAASKNWSRTHHSFSGRWVQRLAWMP